MKRGQFDLEDRGASKTHHVAPWFRRRGRAFFLILRDDARTRVPLERIEIVYDAASEASTTNVGNVDALSRGGGVFPAPGLG